MQKDNNKDKAPAKVTLAMVYGSMDFFRFLQEHSRDRFSRFETGTGTVLRSATSWPSSLSSVASSSKSISRVFSVR